MAGKSSRSRAEKGTLALAAALEPHLDALSEAAQIREAIERELAERARARRRRLDEAELMALIFEHLDPQNPRVCDGIDFDRLIVLTEPIEAAAPPSEPELPATADLELAAPPSPAGGEPSTWPNTWPKTWIGQSWADDVQAILPELLDRPELEEQQRSLLARAPRRDLACLNLRHLARAEALAHLELFVGVCRAERVRFCRVIPGKGIDSKAEPVIKRAVIEWCRDRDAVLGWAPELDRHGEWGAMILELRALARTR